MLRATAPPSEQYNDPSLRTRSKTIDNLIKREDEKSCKEFGRIDSIQKDWANQDKMNKIAQLRSAPPTYSPPKPPPILESKEEDRRLFRSNSMHRARFNTFSMDSLPKIGGKKRKKNMTADLFKMKVFSSHKDHGMQRKKPMMHRNTESVPMYAEGVLFLDLFLCRKSLLIWWVVAFPN